jgi:bifunctional NMN adenylyltransferase/nudix hydrolase
MKEYVLATYLGRFEPPHKSHFKVMLQGLDLADKLLIIVGSYRSTPTVDNPWTYEQRKEMIEEGIREIDPNLLPRIIVEPIRDFYLNDPHWVANVQRIVNQHSSDGDSICMLGMYKDRSSYYFKYFEELYDLVTPSNAEVMNATDVRQSLFGGTSDWKNLLPSAVTNWIEKKYMKPLMPEWKDYPEDDNFGFRYMVNEFFGIIDHKKNVIKYPRNELTGDCLVVQSGCVLVVVRKGRIGKGLFALPGGYIKTTEYIRDGAIRELKEETGIKIEKRDLKKAIVKENYFDYPKRSGLGRVVTHLFVIKLDDGKLAEVRGGDDASRAFWMPFADVNLYEDRFFDDHVHLIRWGLNNLPQEKN